MTDSDDDFPDNEWMRAYLDGDEPPAFAVPYFFLTGMPFDQPVWVELEVIDAIGLPTNAAYITIGVSAAAHVLERRGSSERTQRLTRMKGAVLRRPRYVQRYDEVSQKFAVVGAGSADLPWVLVAGELRPSYTGRDEVRVTLIYPVNQGFISKRVKKGRLLRFEDSTPQEPE